ANIETILKSGSERLSAEEAYLNVLAQSPAYLAEDLDYQEQIKAKIDERLGPMIEEQRINELNREIGRESIELLNEEVALQEALLSSKLASGEITFEQYASENERLNLIKDRLNAENESVAQQQKLLFDSIQLQESMIAQLESQQQLSGSLSETDAIYLQ